MFLPDRFIHGTCPRCKAEDQYGDSLREAAAPPMPDRTHRPVSVVSGKTPIRKESEHYFFKLGDFQEMLEELDVARRSCQPEVRNKLKEWF